MTRKDSPIACAPVVHAEPEGQPLLLQLHAAPAGQVSGGVRRERAVIERDPARMGVDVARFGDDESVIFKRQGMVAFNPLRLRNLDSLQGASHVARLAKRRSAADCLCHLPAES